MALFVQLPFANIFAADRFFYFEFQFQISNSSSTFEVNHVTINPTNTYRCTDASPISSYSSIKSHYSLFWRLSFTHRCTMDLFNSINSLATTLPIHKNNIYTNELWIRNKRRYSTRHGSLFSYLCSILFLKNNLHFNDLCNMAKITSSMRL